MITFVILGKKKKGAGLQIKQFQISFYALLL